MSGGHADHEADMRPHRSAIFRSRLGRSRGAVDRELVVDNISKAF